MSFFITFRNIFSSYCVKYQYSVFYRNNNNGEWYMMGLVTENPEQKIILIFVGIFLVLVHTLLINYYFHSSLTMSFIQPLFNTW